MSHAVALGFSALALSSILALAALGFLVLHQASGVINFAHGDLITLGAYVAFWSVSDLGIAVVPSYLLAILTLVVVGVVLERTAYAPLRKRPHVVVLIATLAAALILRAAISLWQGSTPVRLDTPLSASSVEILGATISAQRILIIVAAAITIAAVALLVHRTRFGRELRAVAQDPEAASLCGVNTRNVSLIAWGLSGGLAALAAVLLAPLTVLSLGFGFSVMLGAFAAAVIGGFGSIRGVCAGALLIGFLEQFVGGYVLKDFAPTLPFIAMLVILAVRPAGLFSTASERL